MLELPHPWNNKIAAAVRLQQGRRRSATSRRWLSRRGRRDSNGANPPHGASRDGRPAAARQARGRGAAGGPSERRGGDSGSPPCDAPALHGEDGTSTARPHAEAPSRDNGAREPLLSGYARKAPRPATLHTAKLVRHLCTATARPRCKLLHAANAVRRPTTPPGGRRVAACTAHDGRHLRVTATSNTAPREAVQRCAAVRPVKMTIGPLTALSVAAARDLPGRGPQRMMLQPQPRAAATKGKAAAAAREAVGTKGNAAEAIPKARRCSAGNLPATTSP